jgi:phosphoglycerate dehydrogenase-like enzyme
MSCTVLYWNRSATPELTRLIEEQMPPGWELLVLNTPENATNLLHRADFIIVADQAITKSEINSATSLKMIQHQGVGYERIDLDACRERGILVGLTPEGTSVGVAEHVLLLVLALYKQLVKSVTATRRGNWLQWELRQNSFELSGKRFGLVGYGRIGEEVARRARAFDASILYFDPFREQNPTDKAHRMETLEQLLADSDIVSLHVPACPQNRHLINAKALSHMRPNAILVNTARGSLVDEPALIAAIREKRIAGAALDVLEQEPPSPDNPLLHFDNVLVTPHISAGTRDAYVAKMRAVFDNLLRFVEQLQPRNIVPELEELLHGFNCQAK